LLAVVSGAGLFQRNTEIANGGDVSPAVPSIEIVDADRDQKKILA
jgi:hypothetical protein